VQLYQQVSNQLVSPASGDSCKWPRATTYILASASHIFKISSLSNNSLSCTYLHPSNIFFSSLLSAYVSNQLVSPASGDFWSLVTWKRSKNCFQSISFPSEWGPVQKLCANTEAATTYVSNQLVSPASGDIRLLPQIGLL